MSQIEAKQPEFDAIADRQENNLGRLTACRSRLSDRLGKIRGPRPVGEDSDCTKDPAADSTVNRFHLITERAEVVVEDIEAFLSELEDYF